MARTRVAVKKEKSTHEGFVFKGKPAELTDSWGTKEEELEPSSGF